MDMMRVVAVPIHREGWKFVAIFAVLTLILTQIWTPLFWPGLALTVWCYYFFRDPDRMVPQGKGLVISPADGIVSQIVDVKAPDELDLGEGVYTRVSIFMNVFNCHVNRMPVGGTIKRVHYHAGKFLNASLDKASEDNERNALTIETESGVSIGVVQIAGLVARRILCLVEDGTSLAAGERFGLIRFGSRLDVYLPEGVAPLVCIGQTAVAGETVLADLDGKQDERTCRMI
jgi:phosphatidylserine decarboxylase